MALRKAVFDRQILSLDVAGFAQSLAERGDKRRERVVGGWAEDADHRHRLLLRTHSNRPRDRHAAKHDEQFATFHQDTPNGHGRRETYHIARGNSPRLRIVAVAAYEP